MRSANERRTGLSRESQEEPMIRTSLVVAVLLLASACAPHRIRTTSYP